MILTDEDIRSLLKEKILLIREELARIKSESVGQDAYYFEDVIERWSSVLNENQDVSDQDISIVSGLGMFAARELNDNDEPIRTLLGDFGSLATRLARR